MTIEITNSKGHKEQVPLWQLPMLVQQSINGEKGQIAMREEKVRQDAEIAALQEQERQRHQQQLAEAVNSPLDLTAPVQWGG